MLKLSAQQQQNKQKIYSKTREPTNKWSHLETIQNSCNQACNLQKQRKKPFLPKNDEGWGCTID